MYINNLLIKGQLFKFRNPSKKEFDECRNWANNNQFKLQQKIIEDCVIEPKITFSPFSRSPKVINLSKLPFILGDVKYLYQEIIKYTELNSNNIQELVNYVKKYIESEEGKNDMLAAITLPGLDPTKLEALEPRERMKIWTMAQYAAPTLGYDTRMILDPEAWEEDQKQIMINNQRQQAHMKAQEELEIMKDPRRRRQAQNVSQGNGGISIGDKF